MHKRVKVMLGVLVLLPTAGMAGAIDMQEQSALDAAEAASPAVRMERYQLEPAQVIGIQGRPLAPTGLSDCEQAQFYRVEFGLPPVFDRLAWRESNCLNDVKTWCCYGIWQIHKLWISQLAKCDIHSVDDIYGDNPLDRQRNACAARYVYDTSGASAWDTY